MKSDRDEIVEAMAWYGRAIDRRDWGLLEKAFLPDAVIRYAGFGGELAGIPALVEYLEGAIPGLDATQHLFGSFIVDTEGDSGHFSCYVQAQHVRLAAGEHATTFTVGGYYENDVRRGPDGWRMTLLDFVPTWTSGNPAVIEHIPGEHAAV
jgi:hypothetical protein